MDEKKALIVKSAMDVVSSLFGFVLLLYVLIGTPLFSKMLGSGDDVLQTVGTCMLIMVILFMAGLLTATVFRVTWLFMVLTGRDESPESKKVMNICEILNACFGKGIEIMMGLAFIIMSGFAILQGTKGENVNDPAVLYTVCGVFIISGIGLVIFGTRSMIKALKARKEKSG